MSPANNNYEALLAQFIPLGGALLYIHINTEQVQKFMSSKVHSHSGALVLRTYALLKLWNRQNAVQYYAGGI